MTQNPHSQSVNIPVSNDPRYSIGPGWSKGKLWIEHESGEGGDFTESKVRAAIAENRLHAYYTENF